VPLERGVGVGQELVELGRQRVRVHGRDSSPGRRETR
jgi:hypothetical protein